jgi:catechol 2,3-dioxygenase-like lactoylglutathione lyase family enzyme
MAGDRVTANLPARDFDATEAFYARLGFAPTYRGDDWMILTRGSLEIEFFHAPGLDPWTSWHSACIRVDDLAVLWDSFLPAGLTDDPLAIPRLTPARLILPGLQMFALVDCNGSLLRFLGKG